MNLRTSCKIRWTGVTFHRQWLEKDQKCRTEEVKWRKTITSTQQAYHCKNNHAAKEHSPCKTKCTAPGRTWPEITARNRKPQCKHVACCLFQGHNERPAKPLKIRQRSNSGKRCHQKVMGINNNHWKEKGKAVSLAVHSHNIQELEVDYIKASAAPGTSVLSSVQP